MPWLISAAQADKFRKSQKSLIILDASLHMQSENRDAKQEFIDKHIIGAQFFDINQFSDPESALPHTLIQDPDLISEKLSRLGIRNDYKIIFYDNSNLHSACRALWMMKVFGHHPNQLYILDGGLAAWEKQIGKTESGESKVSSKKYTATFHSKYLRTLADLKENYHRPQEQVIDVRHAMRFAGGAEPREGVRCGHIPGSFSFPYTAFFDKKDYFLPLDKIRNNLESVCISMNAPIISMCGSGITAPVLDFVLDLMGHKEHAVYDGSWSEWGALKLFPEEKSLDERPIETCLDEVYDEKI